MTAVEWFAEELYQKVEMKGDGKVFDELLDQAKEMDKEQMIKFAKHCLDKSIDLDILMAYNQVEIEYTNQTFKSE